MIQNIYIDSIEKEYSFPDNFLFEANEVNITDKARKINENPIFFAGFEITNNCNLDCKYCLIDNCNKNEYEKISSMKDFIYFLNQKHGLSRISITGGEPFTCKWLFEILDFVENLKIDFRINTNGLLISENEIEKLKTYQYLNELEISFNHPTNDSFFYSKKRNTIPAKIETIKKLQKANINTIVSSILTDNLLVDIHDMKNLICNLGLRTWRLRELLVEEDSLFFTQYESILDNLSSLINNENGLNIYGFLYDYLKDGKIAHRCKFLEKHYLLAKYNGNIQWICGLDLFAGNYHNDEHTDIVKNLQHLNNDYNIPKRCSNNCDNKYTCIVSPFNKLKINGYKR